MFVNEFGHLQCTSGQLQGFSGTRVKHLTRSATSTVCEIPKTLHTFSRAMLHSMRSSSPRRNRVNANYSIKHPIEDFLINPTTITMDDHYQYSYDPSLEYPREPISHTASKDNFAEKSRQTQADDLFHSDDFGHEPSYYDGYVSDEDIASPVENDDYSVGSSNSDFDTASLNESCYHAQTCDNSQELCSEAKAVQVVSVGKAKVVTMPKSVEASPTHQTTIPSSSPHQSPRKLTSARIDMLHVKPDTSHWFDSPRSTDGRSMESPPESPLFGQTMRLGSVRRRPGLSRLHTQPSPEPAEWLSSVAMQALPARSVSFAVNNRLPTPAYTPITLPSNMATALTNLSIAPSNMSKRKLHKFSPSLGIHTFKKTFRRSHSSDSSRTSDSDSMNKTDHLTKTSISSDTSFFTRASSKAVQKMIPRGADERAPPIVLPPCPEDYEENTLSKPQWSARNASVSEIQPLEPRTELMKLHKRRKSLSAFVPTGA